MEQAAALPFKGQNTNVLVEHYHLGHTTRVHAAYTSSTSPDELGMLLEGASICPQPQSLDMLPIATSRDLSNMISLQRSPYRDRSVAMRC
eukprot:6186637-Pleurochrysis_carterae.AAC.1